MPTTASIFGVRISIATATVATLAAVGQPVPLEVAAWGGVKLAHLIFGSVGVAIVLSLASGWGWARVVPTLICGWAAAAFGTPVALHYAPPPAQLSAVAESGYAALFGVIGVYLISGIQRVAKSLADNPWSIIDILNRLRGRGSPPGGGTP